jgi:hypothetical protein
MFLKTLDFTYAHDLSEWTHQALTRITDTYLIGQLALMSDHDDHFMTVNVREMHRFTQACKSVAKLLSEDHVSWEKRDREKAIVAATLKMFVAEKV